MNDKFTILIYEDDEDWKESFKYAIESSINSKGKELDIIHRDNIDTLEEDLLCIANLIMIDHDLDVITGDYVVESLMGDPDYYDASIFYYSGGETLEDLEARVSKYPGHVSCFLKGKELNEAVIKLS